MQSNSANSRADVANVTIVTDDRQIIVPHTITEVVEINTPGPQGPVGPQGAAGPSVPFNNLGGDVFATTSSLQVTGSFLVSGSSTFTNIGPAIFSGSANIVGATTMSSALVSGNVQVLGTASINVLQINTTINSTGSNVLGDAANDTQTLYGSVIVPTGSLTVSGSVSFGASSAGLFWDNTNARLGVGTASPAAKLHVAGEIRVNAGQAITLDTSNNIYAIGAGNQFRIYSGGTASLNIATNGNTLIGTTTDSGYKLDVNGTARIQSNLTITNGTLYYVNQYAQTGDFFLSANGSTNVLFTNGTSNNFGRLQLGGTTTSYPAIQRVSASIAIVDGTGGTAANLLVGTTSGSGYKLDVSGSSQFYKNTTDYIQLLQDANSITFSPNAASYLKYGSNTVLSMKSGGSNSTIMHGAGTAILAATSTGVSIRSNVDGTAATSMLQVRGSGTTSATTALRVENSSASPSLVVLDNGYVGINTGSAQYNLDVSGSARIGIATNVAHCEQLSGCKG